MKLPILTAFILLCLALQPGGTAYAGEKEHREKGGGRDSAPGQTRDFTPKQAAESARRQTGGRVLSVKPANGGYRVKVLTPQGEVRYVPVDGKRR